MKATLPESSREQAAVVASGGRPSEAVDRAAGEALPRGGPEGRGSGRLLQRVAAVLVGVGVFAAVSSLIEPRPSSAREDLNVDVAAAGPWSGERVDVQDAATRDRVQKKLLSAKHPKGWPALGLLEGVEYYVLIHGSPEGPRYTVCSLQGRVLQADLPKDDVYRAFPTLDVEGMKLEPAVVPDGPALMLAEPATRE